jgi:stage V sporulation protein S
VTVAEVTPETNREETIKVSARSDAKALAGTVSNALADQPRVKMRAIGASAVNQSMKAIAIARGYVAQRGQDLVCRPGFETTTDISRPGTSGSNELSCMVFFLTAE